MFHWGLVVHLVLHVGLVEKRQLGQRLFLLLAGVPSDVQSMSGSSPDLQDVETVQGVHNARLGRC